MRTVIDTNVLLVSFSSKSASHWLFQAIESGKIELCVTTEILAEYEEIFSRHWSFAVADTALRLLMKKRNIRRIEVFFRFNLIPFDTDDNKFVDCAVAAGADYLITNDTDFSILKHIPFPNVAVVSLQEFKAIIKEE